MVDDIVTRLRENAAHLVHIGYTSDAEEITQAIDEIERLRVVNSELVKMFKQVSVIAEMWQKTEDEFIEIHHGKCAEQFANQHKEIERLQNRITQLLNEKDELKSQVLSWKIAAENFDNFNENRHNDYCGYGSLLTQQTACYCGRLNYEKTKEALDGF